MDMMPPVPRDLPEPDYAVISGPLKIGPAPCGLYLADDHLAELAKLLRYAAERLDAAKSGAKVSPELQEAEPMVRRVLGWIETVERANGYPGG